MSYPSFESLKITTMTVIVQLDKSLYLDKIFGALPITRIEIPVGKRNNSKFKLPPCKEIGQILSMRYNNCTRGIVRKDNDRQFKNSITIDFTTDVKTISLKLASQKIQMCGVISNELAIDTADLIMNKLRDYQEIIDYLRDNPEKTQACLDWIQDNLRGHVIHHFHPGCSGCREHLQDHQGNPTGIFHQQWLKKHLTGGFHFDLHCQECQEYLQNHPTWRCHKCKVSWYRVGPAFEGQKTNLHLDCSKCKKYFKKLPKEVWQPYDTNFLLERAEWLESHRHPIVDDYAIKSVPIPPELDPLIMNYFGEFRNDYDYFLPYFNHIQSLRDYDKLIDPDVDIVALNNVMVNYNYDLGYEIDRLKLANAINGLNGFQASYNNDIQNMVKIKLPCQVEPNCRSARRKDFQSYTTLLVYKSGCTTMSCSNVIVAKDTYNLFRETLLEIEHLIRK